jgi:hypothetical protein
LRDRFSKGREKRALVPSHNGLKRNIGFHMLEFSFLQNESKEYYRLFRRIPNNKEGMVLDWKCKLSFLLTDQNITWASI